MFNVARWHKTVRVSGAVSCYIFNLFDSRYFLLFFIVYRFFVGFLFLLLFSTTSHTRSSERRITLGVHLNSFDIFIRVMDSSTTNWYRFRLRICESHYFPFTRWKEFDYAVNSLRFVVFFFFLFGSFFGYWMAIVFRFGKISDLLLPFNVHSTL